MLKNNAHTHIYISFFKLIENILSDTIVVRYYIKKKTGKKSSFSYLSLYGHWIYIFFY